MKNLLKIKVNFNNSYKAKKFSK